VTILEAIVLGLVQGLTEFIPISSTAHLRIIPALLGWEDPGAAASAVIQLGTLLAVVIYFFGDIVRLTSAFFRGIFSGHPFADPESRLAWFIIAGTVPVVILGLAFKDFIEGGARSLWIVAVSLIAIALLLLAAERYARARALRGMETVTLSDSIAVGFGQSLALIPGMSRSGSTIMVSLFRGLTHEAAARFSFLLSIPAIFAAGVFQLFSARAELDAVGWTPMAVAIAVSFASGWASIWFLLRYLRTHTTHLFIWYRIALGVILIGLIAGGVLAPMG
jgi:undecaprenyl-diphosphatase